MAKQYQQKNKPNPELKILHNSSETGYAVKLPNKRAGEGSHKSDWNAALVAPFGTELKMWVSDVQMDFSMTGSTGQSRYRKQYYPKSFNQPTIIVKGQMPNQFEYNRLAAFVRECHLEALTKNRFLYSKHRTDPRKAIKTSNTVLQVVTLLIKSSPPRMGPLNKTRRNVKGAHRAMILNGYIKNIAAGAAKFSFAPEFQFEFVIASSYLDKNTTGIYDDVLVDGSQLENWNDQLKKYNYGQQKFASSKSSRKKPTNELSSPAGPPNPAVDAVFGGDPNKNAAYIWRSLGVKTKDGIAVFDQTDK